MAHPLTSLQPTGDLRISGSITANATHVRTAISRLKPKTQAKVLAALADDGAGIANLPPAVLRETQAAIYTVLMLEPG